MPKQDAAAVLGEILSEADALIRLRLKEQGLQLPHLVVSATPDNQIMVRSDGDHEVMRLRTNSPRRRSRATRRVDYKRS